MKELTSTKLQIKNEPDLILGRKTVFRKRLFFGALASCRGGGGYYASTVLGVSCVVFW